MDRSNETHGHSIWLIPDHATHTAFQTVITSLAKVSGSVNFPPHITLLGQLDQPVEWLRVRLEHICNNFSRFELEMKHLGMFDRYFRSIILHVRENHELERIYSEALRVFEYRGSERFVPHLSLMYSNLDNSEKSKFLDAVMSEWPITLTVGEVVLIETSGRSDQWQERARYTLK